MKNKDTIKVGAAASMLGSMSTEKKRQAVIANGKLGGRPKGSVGAIKNTIKRRPKNGGRGS